MALHFYSGNKLENLVNILADILNTPLSSPLSQDTIVIQSRAMERWVWVELARINGICANILFSFPNALLYDIHKRVIPGLPEVSLFEPDIMAWKIMKILPACIEKPGFESLRSYLRGGSGFKEFQIAERIANIFDQYLIFRPEMVFGWEKGRVLYGHKQEEQWQAELWRMVVSETGCSHRARLMETFHDVMEHDPAAKKKLPERISVFGISVLPPFHMNFLASLSKHVEVNFFMMNPCREFWSHIMSDRKAFKLSEKYEKKGILSEDLHLEKGNSLLASLGVSGAEFFNLIMEADWDQNELFEDIQGESMLSCIQADILNLCDRGNALAEKTALSESDFSIQIHSCHSPMREIEVLHDNLLAMFEEDPDIQPSDIFVMTPDIDTYAPFIQAVFSSPETSGLKIPFSIADIHLLTENSLCNTFLSVIDLSGSRFAVSQVMPVIESPAVQRKFNLNEDDVSIIQSWIAETRIRWGIDEKTRKQEGLPAFRENTWKAGLDRLLTGYAMTGHNKHLFNNILPCDNVEGNIALTLGRFAELITRLVSISKTVSQPQTLKGWSKIFGNVLEQLFDPGQQDETDTRIMEKVTAQMSVLQELSGFEGLVTVDVIKQYLKKAFAKQVKSSGFITGGVTFCALLPMRSIPCRVVCMIGMNESSFPRKSREPGFNLIPQDPKPCDRSRQKDDRYLFLETILSARKKLYISYTGQNIKDNSIIPPSVAVSQLIDYLEQGFYMTGKEIYSHVVTTHPLQSFSPRYFRQSSGLFSYSEENCVCARIMPDISRTSPPFFSRGLPEPDDTCKAVDSTDLKSFFTNPSKHLLQARIGLYLEQEDIICEDRENFDVSGLDRYKFEQDVMEKHFAGLSAEAVHLFCLASGILPHGTVGAQISSKTFNEVSRFRATLSRYFASEGLEPVFFDFPIDMFRLKGKIDSIYPEHLINYRYAVIKPKDFLKIWLDHLLLNAAGPGGSYPRESLLIGLREKTRVPAVWKFRPVQDSRTVLRNLLNIYYEGLNRPIAFFPGASFRFAEAVILKGKPDKEALKKAEKELFGNDYSSGEIDDLYMSRCHGELHTLNDQFIHCSLDVFSPLLQHCEEVRVL